MSQPAPTRPSPPDPALPPVVRLVELMKALRSPQGCPWDREQTLDKLKEHLVEETYEVLDAIDSGDRHRLRDELGDLLLQVVFQAQLGTEEGSFTFDQVADAIVTKLIRRHPHVFGEVEARDAAQVLRNWEDIKRTEKKDETRSTVEGIPRHLPALHKAHLLQKRVARVGFDWDNVQGALGKVDEEAAELREAVDKGTPGEAREELGDLLFAAVNVSRFLGHNPEDVLHDTIAKFMRRFQAVEAAVHSEGRKVSDCDLAELDRHWERVKAAERAGKV